ncbi:RND family efflux transporter, MFP subunit [Polaromonas sp. OV174]|uniref:efflux RND transporter periplasmic adaptor subunit n=1 Tax=Polaromonas sp. OV174 TaxID=1855300 RepID=UPI0008F1A043|nr:efflux RND transporter periplasmic adaptor subunit [Polaromonas sp. OV174]SFC46555.1 RND family efflux transporter, MFP subunit [Polaromonas sp. OV174]
MKHRIKWAVALVALLLVGGAVLRTLSARKAQEQALASAVSASQGLVELAATDVVKVQSRELLQGLAVSGSLKAVNSAVIKARVAGELQDLTVREGDFVKAGQVIARIEAGEYQSRVRQAREQAASSKSQVDVAQRQYDNNKALVDQGFISKTALDTSLSNLNAAQSTYKAALAATEVASKSLGDTVLKAPIAGQVSQRLAQPGEHIGVDSKIVEVVDLSRLELEASLSAADAMTVRPGQTAELQIEGSPQTVQAQVVRINPSVQAGSRSVLVYLSLANSGGEALPLRQGLFAQGTLGTARAQLLAVPVSAVRTDKPTPYVQTIENGKVAHRAVTLGARGTAGGEAMVAVQGLADNTPVIRGNIGNLPEGSPVRFTPMSAAQASPAASAPARVKPAP